MASSHVIHHKTQETTHSKKPKNVLGHHKSKEETAYANTHEKQHSLDHHEETHKQKKSTTHRNTLQKSHSQKQSIETHDTNETEQVDRPNVDNAVSISISGPPVPVEVSTENQNE